MKNKITATLINTHYKNYQKKAQTTFYAQSVSSVWVFVLFFKTHHLTISFIPLPTHAKKVTFVVSLLEKIPLNICITNGSVKVTNKHPVTSQSSIYGHWKYWIQSPSFFVWQHCTLMKTSYFRITYNSEIGHTLSKDLIVSTYFSFSNKVMSSPSTGRDEVFI